MITHLSLLSVVTHMSRHSWKSAEILKMNNVWYSAVFQNLFYYLNFAHINMPPKKVTCFWNITRKCKRNKNCRGEKKVMPNCFTILVSKFELVVNLFQYKFYLEKNLFIPTQISSYWMFVWNTKLLATEIACMACSEPAEKSKK